MLIAAADPVSVIAIFREAGIHGRFRVLAEAESRLNDGTAAVAFGIALAAVQGRAVTGGGIALVFIVTVWGVLALVLGLPPDMPGRQAITAAVFAVAAFSIVVQGLTIKSLRRKVGTLPS